MSSDPLLDRIHPVLSRTYHIECRPGVGELATVSQRADCRLARRVTIDVLQTDIARLTTTELPTRGDLLPRLEHDGIVRAREIVARDLLTPGRRRRVLARMANKAPDT